MRPNECDLQSGHLRVAVFVRFLWIFTGNMARCLVSVNTFCFGFVRWVFVAAKLHKCFGIFIVHLSILRTKENIVSAGLESSG